MVAEQITRIDFGPGVYGLDYETQGGKYLGEVYSQVWGNGPTCVYEGGTKIYRLISGPVEGVAVKGKYLVYQLDLRGNGISIAELKDPQTMNGVIEANRVKITKVALKIGKDFIISPWILHQPCGKGILRIEVPGGYEPDKMIETDGVNLSEFFRKA